MTRAVLVSVLMGALLFAGVMVAQQVPAERGWTLYGHGNRSCGGWLEERKSSSDNRIMESAQRSWVLGFISGVGYVGPYMKKTDSDGMVAFIDAYCAAHPLASIGDAAQALAAEMAGIKTP